MTMTTTNFIGYACLNYRKPPVRVYVHSSGLDAFGSPEQAVNHTNKILDKHGCALEDFLYVIAAAWGEDGVPMTDLFGFRGLTEWGGNADFCPWVNRNGEYDNRLEKTCEDGIIMLSAEVQHRRTMQDLDSYMKKAPVVLGADGKPLREIC